MRASFLGVARFTAAIRLVPLLVLLAGCGEAVSPPDPRRAPPTPVAPVDTANPQVTPAELRRKLGANQQATFRDRGGRITEAHLAGSGARDLEPLRGLELEVLDLRGLPISDLSPLAGMPLRELYAEDTRVRDLSPLANMPLRKLYLSHTSVSDLGPLAGMELDELNLVGTPVEDVQPLASARLGTLWLRNTKVRDLEPLASTSLVSLDVEGAPASDLGPLAGLRSLRRLNIARTAVTDVTPLAGLRLERLIFTPARIESGLDAIRNMPSLTALGTRFDDDTDAVPPEEFWRRYEEPFE